MNLVFHSTETFEEELHHFEAAVQAQIVQRINEIAQAFLADRQLFAQQARKPYNVPMYNGFDSSLYAITVKPNLRVILTVDEDPLFDQAIVTLLRVVKRPDLYNTYTAVAQTLYQNLNGSATKQGVPVG